MSLLTNQAKIALLLELRKLNRPIKPKEIRVLIEKYTKEIKETKFKSVKMQERHKPTESVKESINKIDLEEKQKQLNIKF